MGVGRYWGGFSEAPESSSHCTWAGVAPAASPHSLPVRSHGHSALGQSQELGDRRLLPLLQGSARSELLISTTHQHNYCSLEIRFQSDFLRTKAHMFPDKSCGKLEEGGEITLNIS